MRAGAGLAPARDAPTLERNVHLPNQIPGTIIVGGGLAGLFAALRMAPRPVTVIAAAPLGEGAASVWAQGGIAAAVDEGDTAEAHARDTIDAGAGIVDEAVAHMVAGAGAARVHDLLAYGVPFDRDLSDRLVCSREAAHSAKRVVRVKGDGAGRAIMEALIAAVRATPSINVIEGFCVTELIAHGRRVNGLVMELADDAAARYLLTGVSDLVLATGGVGALYARSTNPPYALGSAIALAARAGAAIADAEFVQFHPTAIDIDASPTPLATEALRGEGAVLVNGKGRRFMFDHHADGELGPRDVVARGVFGEIQAGRGAFLDCREAIGSAFPERFPTVYGQCRSGGIDPVSDLIPVTPAEHYHMGGVRTDADGSTGIDGLWVIGEGSSTGLHGANRLASNSLLEAVVFADRVAAAIARRAAAGSTALRREKAERLPDAGARNAAIAMIRFTMGENAGVVRNEAGLRTALAVLRDIGQAVDGDWVVANAALTGRFIVEAALRRKESRGAHYREDFPARDEARARRESMTLAGLNLRDSAMARGALTAAMGGHAGQGDLEH